jgi:dolichyl-phosphate-mannose--protein O-mannosyl transferase
MGFRVQSDIGISGVVLAAVIGLYFCSVLIVGFQSVRDIPLIPSFQHDSCCLVIYIHINFDDYIINDAELLNKGL